MGGQQASYRAYTVIMQLQGVHNRTWLVQNDSYHTPAKYEWVSAMEMSLAVAAYRLHMVAMWLWCPPLG